MRAWSLATPVSIAGARGTYEFLTYVTVLETGGEGTGGGLVVFDSGLDPGDGDAGNGLAGAFRRNGLDPRAVTHVFHSHIHVDHFGGNRLFPRALKLMSREELSYQRRWNEDFAAARDKAAFLRACYPDLTQARSETIADMLAAGQARYFREETLGDPGRLKFFEDVPGFSERGGDGIGLLPSGFFDFIRVLPTPGHTPHHLSFVVLGCGGSAVVTGDLFPARRSFYEGTGGFIEVYSDRREAARSLSLVVRFGEERGDPVICPAHDRPFRFRSGTYLRDIRWSIDC